MICLPVLLGFTTDSDSALQALCKPLFSQMIHWFIETLEEAQLFECLLDTICTAKDTALK